MDKKLLKEINKLRYLNQYNIGKTLNENKVVISEQLGPYIVKSGWKNITEFGLSQAMKLTNNNLAEYFGKELVAEVDTLIMKAISSGRLLTKKGTFNGFSIDLNLSLFRKWMANGSAESMSILERNIFYEAIASLDGALSKKLLTQIAETTEGIALKSGTMSDEAFEIMLKNVNSPLYGFSETFLRKLAKTSTNTIIPGGKKAYEAVMNQVSKAGAMVSEILEKGYKWTHAGMVKIGGTGLFNHSGLVEVSSRIHAALVDKYVGQMAKYEISNIPKVLQKLGLSTESIQAVIKAIQQGVPVEEKITKEIWAILSGRGTKELEVIFKQMHKDLSTNKWFMIGVKDYLELMVKTTEKSTAQQIHKANKDALKKLLPGFTDESLEMILKNLAKKNPLVSRWQKIWYVKGTKTSRFINWISCGRVVNMYAKSMCIAFKVHLLTSILPFFNNYISLKAIYERFFAGGTSEKQQRKLDTLKDIFNPPAAVVQELNDPTRFQFLSPKEDKSVTAINDYYDSIAEELGTQLLTFVPKDLENKIGFWPPAYQENPEFDDKYVQDADSMYAPSNGNGRWYIGPLLSDLNKASDSKVVQYLLTIFSTDWNDIDESKIKNILTTRASRFGLAKLAERYRIATGNNRNLWDDLDQLSYGDGIMQNMLKNLLFHVDTNKHTIDLEEILKLPEYQKDDSIGPENIVVDPMKSMMNDWWTFPKELWDVHQVVVGNELKVMEVQFFPEYTSYMPLELMIALQAEPTFTSEDTKGNKFVMTVKSEADLFKIPAKGFNKFLRDESPAPYDKDLYHYPYIYEQEVVGYEADGTTEIFEWVEKRNPNWTSTPKNTSVEQDIKDKWKAWELKKEEGS